MSLTFSSQGTRSNIQINQKEIFRFGDDLTPEVFMNGEWIKIIIKDSDQFDELLAITAAGTYSIVDTALIFDTSGNLYWAVMNYLTNSGSYNNISYVYKITPTGEVSTFATSNTIGGRYTALAFDTSDNLYWSISNYYDGSSFNQTSYIYKITPGGTKTTFASQATNGGTGNDLAFDTSGNLYWAVSNYYNGTTYNITSYVYKITPAGTKTTFASQATNAAGGTSLAFDTSGNLYWAVGNYYNGTTYNLTSYVYKIDPAGTKTMFASQATNGNYTTSLAFDTSGNLYWVVGNQYNDTIYNLTSYVYKITPSGTKTTFASQATSGISGTNLIFDTSGNLYWSINNYHNGSTWTLSSNVYRITPSGAKTPFATVKSYGGVGGKMKFDNAGNFYWAVCNQKNGLANGYEQNSYLYIKQLSDNVI